MYDLSLSFALYLVLLLREEIKHKGFALGLI